jgi:hypothetical protein
MDDHRGEFRVEPVRSRGVSRIVPIATFLVGIFLGAALAKPWDLLFPAPSPAIAQRPAVSSSAGPTPSPSPSPPPAECAFAGGWRVFALGQPDPLGGDGSTGAGPSDDPAARTDIGNPLRRWLEIDPLRVASGPGDQRIPFVTIVSDRIAGIGYCPPPDGQDGPPSAVRFDAWVLDGAGAPTPLLLHRATLGSTSTIRVPVYIGADPPAGTGERWPAGRYIFAVESTDPGAYGRWFGVEIRSPPGKPPV